MDLDLDPDRDLVGEFLDSKLEEIRSANVQLAKSLKSRLQVADKCQQDLGKGQVCGGVVIDDYFTKFCHDKYVLGVGMRNESESDLENISVVLDWDSASPLDYKYHLISSSSPDFFENDLKCTPRLKKSGKILLVLDAPFFTEQLNYTISGSINFVQNNTKISLKLPLFYLKSDDVTDPTISLDSQKIATLDDILAYTHSSKKYELVLVIPGEERVQRLEKILEIDCSFCKINPTAVSPTTIIMINPSIEMGLLEFNNCENQTSPMVYFNIYCRNRNVVLSLLHHLYKRISNICIAPRQLYHFSDLTLTETADLIKESLAKEADSLEEFKGGDMMTLKARMAELEVKTDVLAARIVNMNILNHLV